jgi:cold shock protein
MRGVVKWWDITKGFGFIKPDDDNKGEVFVHRTGLQPGVLALDEDAVVEFDLAPSNRKPGTEMAVNVRVVS